VNSKSIPYLRKYPSPDVSFHMFVAKKSASWYLTYCTAMPLSVIIIMSRHDFIVLHNKLCTSTDDSIAIAVYACFFWEFLWNSQNKEMRTGPLTLFIQIPLVKWHFPISAFFFNGGNLKVTLLYGMMMPSAMMHWTCIPSSPRKRQTRFPTNSGTKVEWQTSTPLWESTAWSAMESQNAKSL